VTFSAIAQALHGGVERLRESALAPVDVAVLDSGIDATHPDLAGRVAAAFGADKVDGEPVIAPQAHPANHDQFGHGTAVASIIANIAPNARIVDYRVLGFDNTGSGDALVAALKAAVDAGHRVINMSLAAKAEFASKLQPLCDRAYRAGQIVVAAKRNMPLVDMGYPAELTSVISVDRDAFATNLGLRYTPNATIEFVAHGEQVTVAASGGGYTTKTGTSFATPAVAGIVAVLLGAHPDLRPFDVKSLLRAWALLRDAAGELP
jgi:subtilisin family serine protease